MYLHRIVEKYEPDSGELQIEFFDEHDSPSFEDLQHIEMERKMVQKVRANASLFAELFDPDTEYIYGHPFRRRVEVEGGYKIARSKGARLDEVNVFNLVVRFRNSRFDTSEALAFMYRPKKTNQEWIVLLPDDTAQTINLEIKRYQDITRLYRESGKITSDEDVSYIFENLRMLNLHERCAQTLIHEFGHILHWRIFDRFDPFYNEGEAYHWFLHNGYAQSLEGRIPGFKDAFTDEQKLWLLKECLVEDYRISLNMASNDGMFILPGKYTYGADLRVPDLLSEGVEIMQRMLRPALEDENIKRKSGTYEGEVTDFAVMQSILKASMDDNWTPGQRRMSIEDHIQVTARLYDKAHKRQIAASRENDNKNVTLLG
ncbi:hypothetical protein POF51_25810 [Brevibacillus sp. AG]|uniref:hypothetical protein n=1 Tax=Brevibacillus sp. AG TaxID=3020891 RepID=UPI0023305B49|nr:hypothetical protein [Brevibacillus sp. AG]MDC0764139.1 hypothetical protein [Brevibacillus sp. AG]